MRQAPFVLVGGCRVALGGLHLGHVVGCFIKAFEVNNFDTFYFVLSDLHSGSRQAGREGLWNQVAGALALLPDPRLAVVRESALRPSLQLLTEHLLSATTLNQLEDVHPDKRAIKLRQSHVLVSDFLFPVHQAAYMLGLGASAILMNDDNSRYVDLARRLARRINRAADFRLNESLYLERKPVPRLLGPDYKRMAKKAGNTLQIDADNERVSRFVGQLIHARNSPHIAKSTLPDDFLPFVYTRLFTNDQAQAQAAIDAYRRGQLQDSDYHAWLCEVILKWLVDVQRRYRPLLKSPTILLQALADGERRAAARIQEITG